MMINVKAKIHGQKVKLKAKICKPLSPPDHSAGLMGYQIDDFRLFWPDGTKLSDEQYESLISIDSEDKIVQQLYNSEEFASMERDAYHCRMYDRTRSKHAEPVMKLVYDNASSCGVSMAIDDPDDNKPILLIRGDDTMSVLTLLDKCAEHYRRKDGEERK